MKYTHGLACLSIAVLCGQASLAQISATQPSYSTTVSSTTTVQLGRGVAPRLMWGWGEGLRGYCGEFSFQSLGLLYGNYVSAEHYRNAADGVELLIGVNDTKVAQAMKYRWEQWNSSHKKTPPGYDFIDWAATHIDQGHGVIAGMYTQITEGYDEYDHIMPIVAYQRHTSASKASHGARPDVLGIYYNDLYRKSSLFGPRSDAFVKTREACKPAGADPEGPPYDYCMPREHAYGIALLGNQDERKELFASQLEVSNWTEPDWGEEDQLYEPPVELSATLYVSGLTAGQKYTVLRFDAPADVPTRNFPSGRFTRRWDFIASGPSHTLTRFDVFRSDASVFYRTVLGF